MADGWLHSKEAQAAFKAEGLRRGRDRGGGGVIIEPNPMLLYPWAQAERSRGNCAAAVDLYQRLTRPRPRRGLLTRTCSGIRSSSRRSSRSPSRSRSPHR